MKTTCSQAGQMVVVIPIVLAVLTGTFLLAGKMTSMQGRQTRLSSSSELRSRADQVRERLRQLIVLSPTSPTGDECKLAKILLNFKIFDERTDNSLILPITTLDSSTDLDTFIQCGLLDSPPPSGHVYKAKIQRLSPQAHLAAATVNIEVSLLDSSQKSISGAGTRLIISNGMYRFRTADLSHFGVIFVGSPPSTGFIKSDQAHVTFHGETLHAAGLQPDPKLSFRDFGLDPTSPGSIKVSYTAPVYSTAVQIKSGSQDSLDGALLTRVFKKGFRTGIFRNIPLPLWNYSYAPDFTPLDPNVRPVFEFVGNEASNNVITYGIKNWRLPLDYSEFQNTDPWKAAPEPNRYTALPAYRHDSREGFSQEHGYYLGLSPPSRKLPVYQREPAETEPYDIKTAAYPDLASSCDEERFHGFVLFKTRDSEEAVLDFTGAPNHAVFCGMIAARKLKIRTGGTKRISLYGHFAVGEIEIVGGAGKEIVFYNPLDNLPSPDDVDQNLVANTQANIRQYWGNPFYSLIFKELPCKTRAECENSPEPLRSLETWNGIFPMGPHHYKTHDPNNPAMPFIKVETPPYNSPAGLLSMSGHAADAARWAELFYFRMEPLE